MRNNDFGSAQGPTQIISVRWCELVAENAEKNEEIEIVKASES